MKDIYAISLFSSAGIGDLALRANGVNVLVANEYLSERAELFRKNFPETNMIVGDIRKLKSQIIDSTISALNGRQLDILFATPPCQGMSKNGRGKLLAGIRAGLKPEVDERNLLILDVIEIANQLKPKIIIIENVPEMSGTIITDRNGNFATVTEVLSTQLLGYRGKWEIVEFADYGVPQRRQRLITVFSQDTKVISNLIEKPSILPQATHAQNPSLVQNKWVSVLDAISHLPSLDAKNKQVATSSLPFHRVPILDEDKYFWVSNTPSGKGSFDNQCAVCGFSENPTHSASKNDQGINRADKCTPIRCLQCSELLPRPWVKKGSEYRLMSGFTSAYKRMRADMPASTLTKNLSYACSDQKLHPTQNRVLSLLEAFIIHTVNDFSYHWERQDCKAVSDKTIREVIGESIPPKGLEIIFRHIISKMDNDNMLLRDNLNSVIFLKESYVA
jgi:DNA (cytosine-5)-methyltransferase 1